MDKNVRWSQKIEANVKMIKLLLEKEGYHVKYDGSNLVIAYNQSCNKKDLEQFKRQILPFIKHPEKRKEAVELINGYFVRDCYKRIVSIISRNPDIDHRSIAKKINRKKCHRKLKALVDAGLITKKGKIGESFKYKVTAAGLVLPDTAEKEKPQKGEVIAVGPGKILENGQRAEMSVKVGDKVVFRKYSPDEIKIDDQEYYVIRDEDIIAIIE